MATLRFLSSLGLISLVLPRSAPAQVEYSVVDLGTLAGPASTSAPGSVATAAAGGARAVGYSVIDDTTGVLRAFAHDGVLEDLPPLPGDVHSLALASSGTGSTVGLSYTLGEIDGRAVRWDAGVPVELGRFQPTDVAADGTVVGEAWDGSGAAWRAVRWQAGVLTDLGDLGGGSSSASAVEGDDVAGWSATGPEGPVRGVLWRAGTAHPVGTLGGTWSMVRDLRAGRVVGSAQRSDGIPHAFRADVLPSGAVGALADLGSLGSAASHALGVNSAGDAVGVADSRAVLWPATGGLVDLGSRIEPGSGWQLARATGIDDGGRIVGVGMKDGRPRAFLLVPCSSAAEYCTAGPNSTSADGAAIAATGPASVQAGSFTLVASSLPPGQPVLFIESATAGSLPFGNGTLCLAPPIVRLLPIRAADGAGTASATVPLGPLALTPGATGHFQCWYRDPAAGGSAFNLSHGLMVAVCP